MYVRSADNILELAKSLVLVKCLCYSVVLKMVHKEKQIDFFQKSDHNIYNIPATPLNNAQISGFFQI